MAADIETAKATTEPAESAPSMLELIGALNAMMPDAEAQMAMDFVKMLPAIEAAKARGVPAKLIIESLKKKWPDLHHATFRKRLDAAQKTRIERGELICCDKCGQPLKLTDHNNAGDEVSMPEANNQVLGGDV